MTIKQALKQYSSIEIEILLAHALKQSKEFLYLNPNFKLNTRQIIKLRKLVEKRDKGWPIAYLIGYKEFYGLKFKVNRSVLIPRPETEWLVEEAIRLANQRVSKSSKVMKILDVGTGSGCIAISLAKVLAGKPVQVHASDISAKSLIAAEHNAKKYHAKIKFHQSDLLRDIAQKFDIIIANLPYVPIKDYEKFLSNLQFEPKQALTDGTNEFWLMRKFIKQAAAKLNAKGVVLIETDPSSIPALKQTIRELLPKSRVRLINDFQGLARFLKISLP